MRRIVEFEDLWERHYLKFDEIRNLFRKNAQEIIQDVFARLDIFICFDGKIDVVNYDIGPDPLRMFDLRAMVDEVIEDGDVDLVRETKLALEDCLRKFGEEPPQEETR